MANKWNNKWGLTWKLPPVLDYCCVCNEEIYDQPIDWDYDKCKYCDKLFHTQLFRNSKKCGYDCEYCEFDRSVPRGQVRKDCSSCYNCSKSYFDPYDKDYDLCIKGYFVKVVCSELLHGL